MAWTYPAILWLLPALGALILWYAALTRRRPTGGVAIFPLWLVADAAVWACRLRRHLPAGLFWLSLATIIVGTARPMVPWPNPTGYPVVLIIDVSRSMEENDIPPSRILATKAAALDFIDGLPRTTRVAVVSFGNYATVVVPLTDDRARIRQGILGLATQLRTQLGTGLLEGVRAVLDEGNGPPAAGSSSPVPGQAGSGRPRAVAVLLSDGRASDGVPPLQAAVEARARGVRVYTVGVGTTNDPAAFRSGYYGVLDEPTLRAIAVETGGRYFHASAAGRLREIYRELARTIGWERRPTEVTAVMGAVALVMLVVSVLFRYTFYPLH
ncbi:MAG: VWA domain-containing protein [Armatimonadota bacterium]|nr:VWA domain-containing protein [Armatimonadota bacterium]